MQRPLPHPAHHLQTGDNSKWEGHEARQVVHVVKLEHPLFANHSSSHEAPLLVRTLAFSPHTFELPCEKQ